jgi:hypothetical protein
VTGAGALGRGFADEPDAARADAVLPVVRLLLGVDRGEDNELAGVST